MALGSVLYMCYAVFKASQTGVISPGAQKKITELANRVSQNVSKIAAKWRGVRPGSLSNAGARQLYVDQVRGIGGMIDTTKPLEQQARQAFDLRNLFKAQSRWMMSDRPYAEYLNRKESVQTWDTMVAMYRSRGLSGGELWREIINASMRTRGSVNDVFGIR